MTKIPSSWHALNTVWLNPCIYNHYKWEPYNSIKIYNSTCHDNFKNNFQHSLHLLQIHANSIHSNYQEAKSIIVLFFVCLLVGFVCASYKLTFQYGCSMLFEWFFQWSSRYHWGFIILTEQWAPSADCRYWYWWAFFCSVQTQFHQLNWIIHSFPSPTTITFAAETFFFYSAFRSSAHTQQTWFHTTSMHVPFAIVVRCYQIWKYVRYNYWNTCFKDSRNKLKTSPALCAISLRRSFETDVFRCVQKLHANNEK